MKYLAVAAVSLAAAGSALAQPIPDYDFEWVTIGDPGNRPANAEEAPFFFDAPDPAYHRHVGAVDYRYRVARTPLTVAQQFEFVQAYAPYWDGNPWASALIGTSIGYDNGEYFIHPGHENRPARLSWHVAARYANWLHNGKAGQQWAFEDGVYDASTFTQNPDGTWNTQADPRPGAKFWIPTLDEWAKAMHWDPGKNGGEGGYWRYPHGSDEPAEPGWPWDGGETSAGIPFDPDGPFLDVGSYPGVQSPWGLLDGSGAESEFLSGMHENLRGVLRISSRQFQPQHEHFDRLDWVGSSSPHQSRQGVRIASAIPAPGAGAIMLGAILVLGTRRRR